jgi:outer membrane protein
VATEAAAALEISWMSVRSPSTSPAPSRIAVISIQNAIAATNDGQQALPALEEKFGPKKSELKSLSDEIENLKKQLALSRVNAKMPSVRTSKLALMSTTTESPT